MSSEDNKYTQIILFYSFTQTDYCKQNAIYSRRKKQRHSKPRTTHAQTRKLQCFQQVRMRTPVERHGGKSISKYGNQLQTKYQINQGFDRSQSKSGVTSLTEEE